MASEAKFTPGPWKQSHRQTYTGVYSTEVYDADGETIATVAWYPVKTERGIETNREANARLIAAAPELLEALKLLLPVAESEGENQIDRTAFDAARAALSKATTS